MKAVKRRTILLVVAIALVLSMTVGLAMAYFSDSTEVEGGLTVTLGGETKIDEDQYDDHKDIRVENIGKTDVLVRVAVYGPTEITFEGDGWTKSGDYWYYNSVLPVEGTTSTITARWTPPEDLGDDYSVVVIQESDQAVYDKFGNIVAPEADPAWEVVPK